jgi:hypothetical protein
LFINDVTQRGMPKDDIKIEKMEKREEMNRMKVVVAMKH